MIMPLVCRAPKSAETAGALARGSIVMEIVIALAIFSIVCLPILMFVFSSEDLESRTDRSESDADAALAARELRAIQADEINAYENRHSCDVALASLAVGSAASELSGTPAPASSPLVTYPAFFRHDRNTIASIRSVSHAGGRYLIIGANSASTTDPDLYVYSADAHGEIARFQTGPGIADFDISSGYLYAVERSVVSPLWRVRLADIVVVGNSSGSSSPIDRIPLPLQSALPLRVSAMEDRIFVGTDKSDASSGELLMLERLPGDGQGESAPLPFVLAAGREIGAGINDMMRTPSELLVASPSEVELVAFSMPGRGSASGTPLAMTREFDAPGSAGNGKSLASYKDRAYLGRTLGNVEFYALFQAPGRTLGHAGFSVASIIDANRTVLQVEEAFGGSHVALLAKTPQPALLIYRRAQSGSYSIAAEVPLPAIPTAMTCEGIDFVVAMESTSTPIAVIRF